ncbi:Short chain dehydrogenase family protein [Hondaea fermentalgiana]|uniref:Short chain dehydrogenase family protein n=1 Tax=Hondaea fermentalgiana TaxID=2315210 RepID=A0A2R5GES1_9STRA|nr:Short chain dehydrogenase family protein [Hondaea fermentalgiana]|eukprot:GBG29422.1 Short chain dehydrogenase family protein [Hondaea fermentalgiana]
MASQLGDFQPKWFPDFAEKLPRVEGKVFVVTGTTSGTGFTAAKTVVEKGGTLVALNRPSERATAALQKLKDIPEASDRVHGVDCDLQSFASVREAAAKVRESFPEVHCLANNAGIMATPDRATKDGFDEQMQTNHLSHFLLVKELMPCLLASAAKTGEDARIVNHSSGARKRTQVLEEKYFGKNGGNLGGDEVSNMAGPPFTRYAQTKLANSVFTHALADRLEAAKLPVKVFSCHPGASATSLANHLDINSLSSFKVFFFKMILQSADDGAMGLVKCMMDPSVTSRGMYGPNGWFQTFYGPAEYTKPLDSETDQANKDLLWRASEQAIGETFTVSQ